MMNMITLRELTRPEIVQIISKYYNVYKDGSIFNTRINRYLKPSLDHKGYLKSRIYCPELSNHRDKRKPMRIHRIIALFYLDNYSEELQVNHKNGIKTDNRIENLEMVTNAQNKQHFWNNLDTSKLLLSLNNRRLQNGRFGKSQQKIVFEENKQPIQAEIQLQ